MRGIDILLMVIMFWIWTWLGYFLFNKTLKSKIADSDNQVKKIISDAEDKAKDIKNKSELERRSVDLEKKNLDVEKQKLMKNIERMEERLQQKEERIDQRIENLDKEKEKVQEKQKELQWIVESQKAELSRVAWLSPEQAKEQIFEVIRQENQKEIVDFINKFKVIKQEQAKEVASDVISKVLPRIAMNDVSEFTVSTIDLPSEDTKGKIIWREWRNISFFERLTWVELLIDDTPLAVKVSWYEPEKRFIAAETLRRLIKDSRINPIYIEKVYNEVLNSMDEIHMDKWKEALTILNLSMMKPEIVKMIWQFNLRYSYWQNLWIHSVEVARIAEWLANEMWLDGMLAKKAWLLHDIWKIVAWNWEAHAKVWWEVLRKFWMSPVIINAAEGHHYDVEMSSPIAWIVAAADAISAWRPWARFNTKEMFVERMANLEKLITSVTGIEKVYIMQAGREIMTFVNPEQVNDIDLEKTIKEIWTKIEDQLDYPWVIRIVAIRESKIISYLR